MSKSNKKNIRFAWAVLCKDVIVDQQTNNPSLLNIVEEITIPKKALIELPTKEGKGALGIPILLNLFSVWHRIGKPGPLSAEIKINITNPEGETREAGKWQIQLAEGIRILRHTMKWEGIKATSPGIYIFKILKKEKREKSFSQENEIHLKINLIDETKVPKNNETKEAKEEK